jgi:hypothetical protein
VAASPEDCPEGHPGPRQQPLRRYPAGAHAAPLSRCSIALHRRLPCRFAAAFLVELRGFQLSVCYAIGFGL